MQKTAAGSMELDSLKDDQPIQVSSEDETEIETDTKTKDTSVPKSSPLSLRTVQIQELTNQLSLLRSFITTKLKELPTKFEKVNWTLGYLKEFVDKLEIDVLADLKGITDKLVEL
nr:hypothetical protein [Tanacetum cinerariifolium]